jgi:hypothetical protein
MIEVVGNETLNVDGKKASSGAVLVPSVKNCSVGMASKSMAGWQQPEYT